MISLIVAMDRNRAIGQGDSLPWRLPADLAYFRRKTIGHPVIMGRKTYESIGKPLPKRVNIVASRTPGWFATPHVPTLLVALNIEEAIRIAEKSFGSEEIFIIGGGQIFKDTINLADRLYITEVDTAVPEADVFFPRIETDRWCELSREHHDKDEENQFSYDFVVYERR